MDKFVDLVLYIIDCLWFIDVSEAPSKTKKWVRNSIYIASSMALIYLIYLLMKD